MRREIQRRQLAITNGQLRKYEGASNSSRLKLWNPGDSSANTEIKGGAAALRQRARELRRNNAYAHRAVQVLTTNVVGAGIKPVFKMPNQALKAFFDESWKKWANNTTQCDWDDCQNLQGIQSQIFDAVVESGECFILRKRLSSSKGVPLKLQILEADFLDTSDNRDLGGGRRIRQGIEFSERGERLAYHFFRNHPGETGTIRTGTKADDKLRIPASQVIHVFEKKRPGQIRGVSWLHPVMVRLRDLDTFQDASLRKQQISACFAAFVYNATGEPLDNVSPNKGDSTWDLLEKLDSGTIEHLPPGFDIRFSDPPQSDTYPDFVRTELRSIASGLGITYEELTQDYSNVNFSSGRMGFLSFQRNIKRWQNEIMVTQALNKIFDWFVDSIQFAPGAQNYNINPDKIKVSWTTPAREMIDPSKEVPANQKAVLGGFKTLSEVIRSMGYNPDEVFDERAEELKKLKELGIVTDTVPMEKKTEVPKEPPREQDQEGNNATDPD